MEKRWCLREGDNQIIDELSRVLGVSPVLSQVLYNRNIRTAAAGRHFLFDTVADMPDPFLMKDMEKAARRICQAIDRNENIVIFGDYDADGVTSTAVLYLILSELGAKLSYYIPDRQEEGYGLNKTALDKLTATNAELLITVDCGISSYDEVETFKDKMDIIITDHHEPPARLPQAYAILNPKQTGCDYPFKELAGAGVAYKLCQAVWQIKKGSQLTDHIELAALGTIADLVPLVGENRIIAKAGLQKIREGHNTGIQALLDSAQLTAADVTAGRIAFTAAPRLNAAGRIGHAVQGLQLLLEFDPAKARVLADGLSDLNIRRQEIERDITEQAIKQIEEEKKEAENTLIAYHTGWHPGVIGIAASRLVERFYRPSLVISLHDGIGKGSCRSIHGFNIYEALQYASDTLIQFGGHPMAAGFSIKEQDIPALWEKLNEYADRHMTAEDYIPQIAVDMVLQPEEISLALIDELADLEPYGMGNSRPVFSLSGCTFSEFRPIGKHKEHLRFSIANGNGRRLSGVGWSMAGFCGHILEGDAADVAFNLERNEYNGNASPQMILQDIHSAEVPIHLNRDIMVLVYKTLRHYLSGQGMPVWQTQRNVNADLSDKLDGHVICAALQVLEEIGVLEIREDGEESAYYLPDLNGKMRLDTSATFLKYGGE